MLVSLSVMRRWRWGADTVSYTQQSRSFIPSRWLKREHFPSLCLFLKPSFSHLHYTPAVQTNKHFINEWIIAHNTINGQFCLNLEINCSCSLFTQKLRTEMFFFEYERRNKESQRPGLEDRFIMSKQIYNVEADPTGASWGNIVAKNRL